MTETFDVTLDGTGYMVKPGAYQRFQDGQSEGRVGRVRLFDFYGGGKRAAQLERDRFWSGVGAWPTLDSQGVIAGPAETDRTLTPATAFVPTARRWSFSFNGTWYVLCGTGLYSVATSGGSFSDLTLVQTFAGTILDCVFEDSTVYVALGTGNDIASYDFSTSTYDSSFYADSADLIGIENGIVLWVRSAEPWKIVNTGSWISTAGQGKWKRLVQVGGHLWAMSARSIVRYTTASATTATVVGEATMPDFAADDDFDWAINHFGKLWTWAGKEVVYYDTANNEFVGTGVRGQATRGACTVGSWLVTVIDDLVSGDPEMWAYDGRGWWQLEDGSTAYDRPVSIFGSCDDADMLSGRGTTNQHAATWQFFDRSGAPAIRSSYELITALLDAGERDLDKVWRRAGVEIATPDARATADSVTVALSYSVDGGANVDVGGLVEPDERFRPAEYRLGGARRLGRNPASSS